MGEFWSIWLIGWAVSVGFFWERNADSGFLWKVFQSAPLLLWWPFHIGSFLSYLEREGEKEEGGSGG